MLSKLPLEVIVGFAPFIERPLLLTPEITNLSPGAVVPMPTLPAVVTFIPVVPPPENNPLAITEPPVVSLTETVSNKAVSPAPPLLNSTT